MQARPAGAAAQVVTPFAVRKSAPGAARVDAVFVTDAAGRHEVRVAQVK